PFPFPYPFPFPFLNTNTNTNTIVGILSIDVAARKANLPGPYVFGKVTPRCPWYLPPRSL
ncbi:MAG: hypothetical protein JWQ23_4227, partial [Herminiimonas sp.]|nr:hypothetical protein [Herminiimonas sp.]